MSRRPRNRRTRGGRPPEVPVESRARLSPSRPPSSGVVVPFRRRAVRPPRRRKSLAAALVRGFLGALLLVGGPAGATAWALSSSHFALASFELGGTERVPEAWLLARLEPLRGRNLLWLPLAEVDRALAGHPWIGGLEVHKDLPARLIVMVEQRIPAARIPLAGEIWLADAEGEPIAPQAGEPDARLVLVTVPRTGAEAGTEAEAGTGTGPREIDLRADVGGIRGRGVPLALAVSRELAAAAPAWAQELHRVDVLSEEDARLHSDALPCPLLVRAGSIEERAARLSVLLAEVAARYPGLAALDLRFSRRIVVQPDERDDAWASQRITT